MRWQTTTTLLLIMAGTLAGCLERKETIRVMRDGAAQVRLEYTGDPGDFDAGDAMPTDKVNGWSVESLRRTENDKEQQETKGRLEVAAGKPFPDSFAAPDDPAAKVCLHFPTEIKVEKRRDGTYYHFRRTYQARQHARFEYWRQQVGGEEKLKELSGKSTSELTDDQRRELIGVLRMTEAGKRVEFVEIAADKMRDKWPQDYGLQLRQGVLDVFQNADMEPLVALLSSDSSDERDHEINRMGDELVAGAREVMEGQLKDWHVPKAQVSEFFAAYDQEEQRRVVTEDLADEKWHIELQLPGELVAHNGIVQQDGSLIWEFDASALNDRDQVLMATSRLGPGGEHSSGGDGQ